MKNETRTLLLALLAALTIGPIATAAEPPLRSVTLPALGVRAVELRPFDLFLRDLRYFVDGVEQAAPVELLARRHWMGRLTGEPGSRVFVSVSSDGSLRGTVESGDLRYRLLHAASSKSTREASLEALVDESEISPSARPCGAEQWVPTRRAVAAAREAAPVVYFPPGLLTAQISVDADTAFFTRLGDEAAVRERVEEIFGTVSAILDQEIGLALQVNLLSIWSTDDPWSGTRDGEELLQEYRAWWETQRPYARFLRAAAHLLTTRPAFSVGGIAYLPGACTGSSSTPYDVGVSQNQIDIVAHELGHNFGSPHTHCYEPPVDQCYAEEEGCYSGVANVPSDGGSLMSYCTLRGAPRVLSYGAPGQYGVDSQRVPETLRAFVEEVYGGCLSHRTDPFALRAALVTSTSVTLAWTDVLSGEKNWVVEQQQKNGTWKAIRQLKANASSQKIAALKRGTVYRFRVYGKFARNQSEPSFVLEVRPGS